jgi:hypothetical protein
LPISSREKTRGIVWSSETTYFEDYDKAFQSSVFWRATMLKNTFNSDISDPRKLERKAKEKVPITNTNISRQTKRMSFLFSVSYNMRTFGSNSNSFKCYCPMTLSALVSVVGCGV